MNKSLATNPSAAGGSHEALQALAFSVTGILIGIGSLVVATLQLRRMYNRPKRRGEWERNDPRVVQQEIEIGIQIEMV